MDSIVLSKKEFHELTTLVYTSCGIHLHDGKLELLKSKLSKRMRLTNKSLKEYLAFLYSNEKEMTEFIDTVTTNHSFFFRENKSIEYIVNQFNCNPKKHTKEFKIWCAACSTGDEPYSVAIQLKHLGLSFSILATDISHSVLDIAARGIYKNDKIQKVPLPMVHQFFRKGTAKFEGHVKIKKEIRRHIVFQKLNLIKDPLPQTKFDAVLCRNVMIYFDVKTSKKVIANLYKAIVPQGFFAIGNSESLMNMDHKFNTIKTIPSLYIK